MDRSNSSSKVGIMNMIRVLTKQKRGINICHLNAQSLNNKIDEFRFIFENSSMDIICVSETWLKETTPDCLINLRGYQIFRADRKSHAGGVAIYVKDNIKCSFKCKSTSNNQASQVNAELNAEQNAEQNKQNERNKIEYIFIEIMANGKKLLIGCVYRPNKYISTDLFMEKVEDLTDGYSDVIIAGDFNCNILLDPMIADNMISLDLVPINCRIPTHFTNTSNTLLDLFFVNNIAKVKLYDQLSAPCFSKHDLIFTIYDFNLLRDTRTITYRDFKHINYQTLSENFSLINWNCIHQMASSDEQLNFLENNISDLYNVAVPIKTNNLKENTRPWFSNTIRRLINLRDEAYSRWKKFRIPQLKDEFIKLRRDVNREIRRAKSAHYADRFSKAIDSKRTWQTIRDIGIGGTNKNSNCDLTADELNNAFTNLPTIDRGPNIHRIVNNNLNLISDNQFEFHCVNDNDVLTSLLKVKSNAIGYDNMDPRFIKLLLPQLLPFITYFFNTILTTSVFPKQWKHAKIIPVPKSNSEYRPIAILPFLSKVLEKLMHTQISDHLNRFNLLTDRQSGFRPRNSCITALINVSEDIRSDIDVGKVNILVLLDHSKAFDTVDHSILSLKLSQFFNFSSTSKLLLNSYLSNRYQSVFLNDKYSSALPVVRGVPQGSILGPLLFSLYVNDLPNCVTHSKLQMYADDVQLYLSSSVKLVNDGISKINHDLNEIYLWASENRLCLNPLKSKCLVIHKRSTSLNTNFDIVLNNRKIEIVSSIKNLGIIFNNNLSWSNHVNSIIGKMNYMLRTLWPIQYCTPLKIRMLIAKVYLMPSLLYGCELFAHCDSTSKGKLKVIYNKILRYVFGLKKSDHLVSSYTKQLFGMSLENLMNVRILTLLHKIINVKEPKSLFDRLRFFQSVRGKKLVSLWHRSLISEWQFYFNAIQLWNLLPNNLQTNNNATSFKKVLVEHFSL